MACSNPHCHDPTCGSKRFNLSASLKITRDLIEQFKNQADDPNAAQALTFVAAALCKTAGCPSEESFLALCRDAWRDLRTLQQPEVAQKLREKAAAARRTKN